MALSSRATIRMAALWARQIGTRVTIVVRPGPEQLALRRREARKNEIIRFMKGAGGHSAAVALTSRASLAMAMQMPVGELQPLLDELVAERRVFLAAPPLPSHHYSLTRWRPDWPPQQ